MRLIPSGFSGQIIKTSDSLQKHKEELLQKVEDLKAKKIILDECNLFLCRYKLEDDWKDKIQKALFGDNEKLKVDSRISSFEFTFRSSVEHYYPQNPIEGERKSKKKKN